MTTTIVLFEDVEPFADLYMPITFRAAVDYDSINRWSVTAYEAKGADGGWIQIRRGHALWPVLDQFAISDGGYEVIEDQIAGEIVSSIDPATYYRAA